MQEFIRAADSDVEEGGTGGGVHAKNLAGKIAAIRNKRERYGLLLATFERAGESQILLTDPDSRAMAAHTKVGVGYKVQVAVDAKRKLRAGRHQPGCRHGAADADSRAGPRHLDVERINGVVTDPSGSWCRLA
jgi:hypothetical protein